MLTDLEVLRPGRFLAAQVSFEDAESDAHLSGLWCGSLKLRSDQGHHL